MVKKNETLIGKSFGRLMVIGLSGVDKHQKRLWVCKCVCGTEDLKITTGDLMMSKRVSCGCKKSDDTSLRNFVHGDYGSTEYHSYCSMKDRCGNANNKQYADYGGRGISVCDRWMDSKSGFINFINDMGRKPTPNHTLDRYPNNNGNYEPTNCRWATTQQQNNNKRSNRHIEYNGVIYTRQGFANKIKIHSSQITYHLNYANRTVSELVEHFVKLGKVKLEDF